MSSQEKEYREYVFMMQIISKIQIFPFRNDGWTCQIYYWEYLKWANRISENADTSGHGDHLVKLKEIAFFGGASDKKIYLVHFTKNSSLLLFIVLRSSINSSFLLIEVLFVWIGIYMDRPPTILSLDEHFTQYIYFFFWFHTFYIIPL